MQICVGSIFRTAAGHIPRYAAQVEALRGADPDNVVRVALVEGDSSDNSWELLNEAFPGSVVKRNHGGPEFGSVDSVQRYRQFSLCYEAVLEQVTEQDEVFVYVEGDLIFDAKTIYALIDRLSIPGVDMVAPFIEYQKRLYDIWAMRAPNGDHLGLYPPHHVSLLEDPPNGLYPLSSAGSCIVMKGEVAKRAHFLPAESCVVGFCKDAGRLGYKLFMDPELKVNHPE